MLKTSKTTALWEISESHETAETEGILEILKDYKDVRKIENLIKQQSLRIFSGLM